MHYYHLRRAWHRAMARGRYLHAWAILGELGETDKYASWLDMRDDYVKELSWDG